MTDIKETAGLGKPQTALKSIFVGHSQPIRYRLKATVYRLAPWLFLLGGLHA